MSCLRDMASAAITKGHNEVANCMHENPSYHDKQS